MAGLVRLVRPKPGLPGGNSVRWMLVATTTDYTQCIRVQQWAELQYPLGFIFVERFGEHWMVYVGHAR